MTAIAKIYVNNIEVGSVPADLYLQILNRVRNDYRIKLKQALNIVGTALSIMSAAVNLIPTLCIVSVLMIGVIDPLALIETAKNLATVTPTGLRQAIVKLLYGCGTIALIYIGAFAALSGKFSRYGYRDFQEEEINYRLRHLLEVPAEGGMKVCVVEDKDHAEQND